MEYDLIVLGGGAAGVFSAIQAKTKYPNAKVALLEKSAVLLAKVRISGGGRCNVTHACFEPGLLAQNYPRGGKELISPFHKFQPKDTIAWFDKRGVPLKTEKDGRMFPTTDSSETIIEALLKEAEKLSIEIQMKARVQTISKENELFILTFEDKMVQTKNLLLATGSSKEGHLFAEKLGHSIIDPVPSLFTFNVPTSPLLPLSGVSLEKVEIHFEGAPFSQTGPFLLTHFGFSGPAALKLSAFAARFLFEKEYKARLIINWVPDLSVNDLLTRLLQWKEEGKEETFGLSRKLWKTLLQETSSNLFRRPHDIPLKDLRRLAEKLHADPYEVNGKTTHKEEFVTAGGIPLKEVDFKTLESKKCQGLYFAGEILDIDGITGGFNFQNAWTTAFIAGNSINMVSSSP